MNNLSQSLRTVLIVCLITTIYIVTGACSPANKEKKSSDFDGPVTHVIAQLNLEDILRHLSTVPFDESFNQALHNTAERTAKGENESADNYPDIFVSEYRRLIPDADFSLVFDFVDKADNDARVAEKIKMRIRTDIRPMAIRTLEKRMDVAGLQAEIESVDDNDTQVRISLTGTTDKKRIQRLLEQKGNIEFFTTYTIDSLDSGFTNGRFYVPDNDPDLKALAEMLASYSMYSSGGCILGYACTPEQKEAIERAISRPEIKSILPDDFFLCWGIKPEPILGKNTEETNRGYAAYALRRDKNSPLKSGAVLNNEVIIDADAFKSQGAYEISIIMNDEGARRWANITKENLGMSIAEVIDGKVYFAPKVNLQILGGRSSITGNFSAEEATEMVNLIKSGKAEISFDIINIK